MSIQINGTSGISGVDGTAGTPALQGTDSNTGISFGTDEVNINTGGSTRATVDSSGRLLVGTSTARGTFFGGSATQIALEVASAPPILGVVSNSNDIGQAYLALGKSRGTAVGSHTVVQSGDYCGTVSFQGADGDQLVECARIDGVVDGTPGNNDMPGMLRFSTTADGSNIATERMRISQDGTVLMSNFNGGYGSIYFQGTSGAGGYSGFHQIDVNAYTIGQNSNVRALRIGSGANWLTTGVNLAAGGTSWGTYSDERLKEDIVELNGCLEQISDIRCVTYRLKDVDDADSKKRIGVIAQDLEGKFDEALNASRRSEDDENEYLSVQYADLVPVLIKSLQEAKERIETLEAKVAALKAS